MAFDEFDQPTRPQSEHQNPFASPLSGGEESAEFDPTFVGERLNPWLSIWTQPRATIRQIVERDPTHMVLPLAALSGVSQMLNQTDGAVEELGIYGTLGLAIVVGPLVGILQLYILAWLYRLTCGWLGGVATTVEMRSALAWSSVPNIWALLLWVPLLALIAFNNNQNPLAGMENGADFGGGSPLLIPFLLLAAIGGVIALWQLIIMLKCIGEVSQFSAWRALLGTILAGLVVALPIVAVVFIVIAATA